MKRLILALWTTLLVVSTASAAPSYPSTSIYNLPMQLETQSGAARSLDLYRGKPVLITMFYSSCPMACPLLIDTVRTVERALPANLRGELRVLMVSFDPVRDTPAALAKLVETRRIDTHRWTLARTDRASVRKLAALLNIQYRELPGGAFNHTSVITVLTPQGEIAAQSSMIGKADPQLLEAIDRQFH